MFNHLGLLIKNKVVFSSFRKLERGKWNYMKLKDWYETGYPWRLREEEFVLMQKIIENKDGRVAILGSTPEIRNILKNCGVKVDVIDSSRNMYSKMSKICGICPNENFIEEDWIDYLSSQYDKYSLIIGDLVERLLSNENLVLLRDSINNALVSGGKVLLRTDFYTREHNVTIEESIKQIDIKDIDGLFFALSGRFLGPKNKVMVDKMMLELGKKDDWFSMREKNKASFFIQKWGNIPFIIYCRTLDEIESIWDKYFFLEVLSKYKIVSSSIIALVLWTKKK
jgi:hypothetical protein